MEEIERQGKRMVELVCEWAAINSFTHNLEGVEKMLEVVGAKFDKLGALRSEIQTPAPGVLGKALSFRMRPDAKRQILLCGHVDTVYPPYTDFQQAQRIDEATLGGPGVADMKGGLVVMLVALEALERCDEKEGLGWEVLLMTDEEVGSPGSRRVLEERASLFDYGLDFEPALPNGSLVSARKASGHFRFDATGQAAHAGRDFGEGRNAIVALAELATRAAALSQTGTTVNVGMIKGGVSPNVVPDEAMMTLNVRTPDDAQMEKVREKLHQLACEVSQSTGVEMIVEDGLSRPAKVFDQKTRQLFLAIQACGAELGIDIGWEETGGVSNGNTLAAAGLTVADTMGVRGGEMHSPKEYLLVESLTERAKLTASLLIKMAKGEIK